MATLELSLPDEMIAFMERQAAELGFDTAGDYLRSIIGDLQRRKAKEALEAKLREGLEGPAVPMTREDWDDIRREGLERLARERSPR
jgi:antitoxin ParD1/3/4